jgi:hypothetical protein
MKNYILYNTTILNQRIIIFNLVKLVYFLVYLTGTLYNINDFRFKRKRNALYK